MLYNEPSPLETRILTRRFGLPNSASIDTYLETDGYKALDKACKMKPEEIIEELKTSNLRGRGGAGFPTGMKWSFVPRTSPKPKYIVVNADESEPGTCKDRLLIENDPHQLIEGVLIAGLAVDGHAGYIYVRGEYRYLIDILDKAIAEAYARGYLGKNILGTGFDFDLYTHTGAGAYECGEESALLESLEGKRGIPRIRPPFPAVVGAFQCPTVLNNVETFCAVPRHHPRRRGCLCGSRRAQGWRHKLTCLTGHVNKPGVYELPLGFPVKRMIEEVGGGILGGKKLKAFIPGGSSCPVLTGEECEADHGLRCHGQEKYHARVGRGHHHARGHVHGESGAAHYALLRARKLRLVYPVPRGHHLVAAAAAAISRRHGAAQRHHADRRSRQEYAGPHVLPAGGCGGDADHLHRREISQEFEDHLNGKPCPYEDGRWRRSECQASGRDVARAAAAVNTPHEMQVRHGPAPATVPR